MQISDGKGNMTSWFYSNSVKAYPDEADLLLKFGITFPNHQTEDVISIVLSWPKVKKLHRLLDKLISNYEKMYDVIPYDDN